MKKETVGKASVDLSFKEALTRDPIALEREAHRDYEKNLLECLARTQLEIDGDFYLVVLTKKERLLTNVIRHYFIGRQSCPTPDYDQTVYRYVKNGDDLQFCWVIPSKDTCELFRDNKLAIDPSEWELLKNVLNFYDGILFELAKTLNNEKKDSPLLEN